MLGNNSSRYYIPAFSGIYTELEPYMLPLLRITLGALLIPHACQKLFGWFGGLGFEKFAALFDKLGYTPGTFWVTVVAMTELAGGLMLIFGFFTRFAALAVTIFMINAVWFTSNTGGFFWTKQGSEFSILLLVVALVFLVRGGGEMSMDRKMGKEL